MEDVKIIRDQYGRRVDFVRIESDQREQEYEFGRKILDPVASQRTNSALLDTIFHGGEIVASVSDTSQYFDPGHELDQNPALSDRERVEQLPLHRVGVNPAELFSSDSGEAYQLARSVYSEALTEVERRKAAREKQDTGSPASN